MVNKITLNLSTKVLVALAFLGIVLINVGIYVGFKLLPNIITNKIWESKVLKENTQQWDVFVKTPFPFNFKVYLYDIQNPEDILQGAKPIVKEVGPFVYRVYKWKDEIDWTTSDDISYNGYTRYEFDNEASREYKEDTEITVLNTPYLGILLKVEATQPEAFALLEGALPTAFGKNDGVFIKVKLKDYLWDGLKFCENEGNDKGFATAMLCKQVIGKMATSRNLRLSNHTVLFANMYYKNNTHLGRFTVKSGQNNREEAGKLSLYNGKPYISTWPGEHSMCNKIRGVTTIFPAEIKKDMVFESYAEDICRHVALEYESEEEIKNLKGFKFAAKNDTFKNSIPENSCFCANKSETFTRKKGCVKDGVTDLTPCTGGPVMVSFPHLLYADKEYVDSVEGLNPEKEKHEPYIVLEPLSGLPLKGSTKIQFNMFVRPIDGLGTTANITRALIPLLWVEESFVITDEFVKLLNDNLFRSIVIVDVVKWVVIVTGAACLLFASLVIVYRQAP